MTKAISIKNLTKYYKNFKALDQVSFGVEEGEFFGFLGPNGAGKTTTINVLTGLANYSQGEVKVFGHDVMKDYRKTRGLIGLVPQEFNFDPFLSAEQILRFEGGYFGMEPRDAKKRAQELLERFNIWDKRKDGYKKLSGGMKRRLLIARALMHDPKILILDEPTAGVDLELRYHLWSFFTETNKQGRTIILTTHYIEEAEKLCKTIGVIDKGKLAALDETDALIRDMHGEQVELHFKTPLQEIPSEIKMYQPILEEGGIRLRFEEKSGAVNQVLKALHGKGVEIVKVDVRHPTLEDAFLSLVRRK